MLFQKVLNSYINKTLVRGEIMAKKKGAFPTFPVIVLILAVLWILGDTGILTVKVPWFPVIIGVVALGWIIDFYHKKK